ELGFGAGQRLRATAVELLEVVLAFDDVQRSALLGTRFREKERAFVKVEGRQTDLARQCRLGGVLPLQTARDHQVHDEVQVVFEMRDDALAHAAKGDDALVTHGTDWRRKGAEEERTLE